MQEFILQQKNNIWFGSFPLLTEAGVINACSCRLHGESAVVSGTLNLALHVGDEPELVLRKTNYQVAILPTRPVVMRKIGLVMKDKNTMPIASKYFIEFLFQHIDQLP